MHACIEYNESRWGSKVEWPRLVPKKVGRARNRHALFAHAQNCTKLRAKNHNYIIQVSVQSLSQYRYCTKRLRVGAMKLLTVNMCMEAGKLAERLEALGKLVQQKRPEFIALQSVSNETVKKIKGTMWGQRYNITHPPTKFETRSKPSVAILSAYPAESFTTLTYHDTACNRMLLKAYFVMYDKQKQPHIISFCTTRLEPGTEASEVRERQLNEALLSLMDDEDCFVLGDFNLMNEIDGEIHFNGGWRDAWLLVDGNTTKNGETHIPGTTPLNASSKDPRGRPDRIFFRARRYRMDSIEIVGKDPISGPGVHVSPHFGLLASFSALDPANFLPFNDQPEVACFFERPQWSLSFKKKQ